MITQGRGVAGGIAMAAIRILAILLSSVLLWSSASAQGGADIRYATGDTVNVRSEPSGAVVGSLQRGEAVVVTKASGTWSQVDTGSRRGVWVSTSLLCHGVGCWARSGRAPTTRSSLTPSTRTAPANTYRPSGGGSCPCSGPSNCVGPRGGRYCITSGGNRRYR